MEKTKIFFAPLPPNSDLLKRISAMQKLIKHFRFDSIISAEEKVAVKTHFGDVNNDTHIAPEIIQTVIPEITKLQAKPFLTETSTLYQSPRSNAIDHIKLAYEHGFTYEKIGAPIIMADGLLGNSEIEVEIPGELYETVNIARDVLFSDALIVFSHPTGHLATGFGACIKNLAMGLCSRKGKLKQHSSIKPYIDDYSCTICEQCIEWCPENAIIANDNSCQIISEKCIGCGECVAVCKFGAVRFNYAVESADLQKRIAEYALGAIIQKRDKFLYINVLADMTTECDCMNVKQNRVIPDIGILLSTDAVAIDQATLDLTEKFNNTDLGKISFSELDPQIQIKHGLKIGLGTNDYELVEI